MSPSLPLVTVCGQPGAGKSTLIERLRAELAVLGRHIDYLTIDRVLRIQHPLGGASRSVEYHGSHFLVADEDRDAVMRQAAIGLAAGSLLSAMLDASSHGRVLVHEFAPVSASAYLESVDLAVSQAQIQLQWCAVLLDAPANVRWQRNENRYDHQRLPRSVFNYFEGHAISAEALAAKFTAHRVRTLEADTTGELAANEAVEWVLDFLGLT